MEDLFSILTDHIRYDKKHKYAKEIKSEAEWCYSMMTGLNQSEYVVVYKESESETEKQQRIRFYNSRTSYPANKIFQKWKEVERADTIVDNIWYDDESPKLKYDLDLLKQRLQKFGGKKDYNKWMHKTVRRLNFFDPNAFIVISFENTDHEGIIPFPYVVASKNIVDFSYTGGVLNYLISKYPVKVKKVDLSGLPPGIKQNSLFTENEKRRIKEGDGFKYYIYGPDKVIVLTEIGDYYEEAGEIVSIRVGDTNQEKSYLKEEYNHASGITPAMQVGYIEDPRTEYETFVSPLFPARSIFDDLINTKSEYDLYKALHGFAQKFAFTEHCNFVSPDKEPCRGGYLSISKTKCPECNGSGKKIHSTVQDVVLIEKPANGEQYYVPLKDMVHYVEIPEYIGKTLRDDLDKLERDITQAILNTDVFDRKEIADTATGKRLDMQSFYNVLTEYNVHYCATYKEGVHIIAKQLRIDQGLAVEKSITKDYRLESLDELIAQRKSAMDASAPHDIIAAIDISILAKQSQDNEIYIQQITSRERFRPFRDKSKDETMFILTLLPETHPARVLWTYFDEIFEQIYSAPEYRFFYMWQYKLQKAVVDAVVQQYIDREATLLKPADFRSEATV